MAIHAEIADLDKMYEDHTVKPILLNDFDIRSEADIENVNKMIMTQHGPDAISVEPRCDCEKTRGGQFEGSLCRYCGTTVRAVTERSTVSSIWFRTPKGVSAFINPKVYTILSKALTISKFSILEHLVCPTVPGPDLSKPKPKLKKYMSLKIPRGINYFKDNFEEIMDKLFDANIIMRDDLDRQGKMGSRSMLAAFLQMYRDRIFVKHLPFPSKLMLITETTNNNTTFASIKELSPALSAARLITEAEHDDSATLARRQTMAMKANIMLASYHATHFYSFFDRKRGWIKEQMYANRSHFSFRTVINSITTPHHYRSIIPPWPVMVTLMRPHILGKLFHRGWTYAEAARLLKENTGRYNKLLHDIMLELIAEGPEGRIPVLYNRNPTLLRGSGQLLYITDVKTDMDDKSTSISVLVLKSYGADFDGRELPSLKLLNCWKLSKVCELQRDR